MIATRRLGRARHEFRFGTRELVVLGVVFCLIVGFAFAAGVLVGRETSRGRRAARVEAAREPGRTEADGLRGEAPVKTAATRTEEKVTFYRTLTAPTLDLPQIEKPKIEERLVPKDEPSPPTMVDTPPEPSRAAPERLTPKAPEAVPSPRPAGAARAPSAPPARPAPAQLAAATTAGELEAWTVQVSAVRSRPLADELRARLAARGFDVYVLASVTEDGRPRYRVRVGAYPTRSDAERAATELRGERGLNPLVVQRTR